MNIISTIITTIIIEGHWCYLVYFLLGWHHPCPVSLSLLFLPHKWPIGRYVWVITIFNLFSFCKEWFIIGGFIKSLMQSIRYISWLFTNIYNSFHWLRDSTCPIVIYCCWILLNLYLYLSCYIIESLFRFKVLVFFVCFMVFLIIASFHRHLVWLFRLGSQMPIKSSLMYSQLITIRALAIRAAEIISF